MEIFVVLLIQPIIKEVNVISEGEEIDKMLRLKFLWSPDWCGSLGCVSSRKAKFVGSIPSRGTGLGCGFSPQWGCIREATDQCSLSDRCLPPSLSPSLPLSLKLYKHIFNFFFIVKRVHKQHFQVMMPLRNIV